MGNPFSPNSCVGWIWRVESEGLPESSPRRSPREARSVGVRESWEEKKATPCVDTVVESELITTGSWVKTFLVRYIPEIICVFFTQFDLRGKKKITHFLWRGL